MLPAGFLGTNAHGHTIGPHANIVDPIEKRVEPGFVRVSPCNTFFDSAPGALYDRAKSCKRKFGCTEQVSGSLAAQQIRQRFPQIRFEIPKDSERG